jgi:hypothetical protein
VIVANIRRCDQCGTSFVPRREHARFCSARCRVAWNRQNSTGPGPEQDALDWSSTAMREATDRLLRYSEPSRPHGFVMISEAVWWITIVDATLVRYHPDAYNAVLAGQPAGEREQTEGTLGGLRFVRNWMGYHLDHSDFIRPRQRHPGSDGVAIATWTWRSLPEPAITSFAPVRKEWELERYQAYQTYLAGHAVGEVFDRAAGFLGLATAQLAA